MLPDSCASKLTCVWDSLFAALDAEHYERLGLPKAENRELMLQILRGRRNIDLSCVCWQDSALREPFLSECRAAIDVTKIEGDGYWMSTCDPLLVYTCAVFRVNVEHTYCGHTVRYTNANVTEPNARALRFSSDSGHFRAL